MRNSILLLLLLAGFGLRAQTLPTIELTTLSISQGEKDGFVMSLPGVDPEEALKEWKMFTYLMFAPMQSGEGQPRFPITQEDDANDQEYHTTGLYLPNLSQNTVEAYFFLDSADIVDAPASGQPTTRFSLAIDFGNDNFLDTEDSYRAEAIKHLLYRFYFSVEQTLAK